MILTSHIYIIYRNLGYVLFFVFKNYFFGKTTGIRKKRVIMFGYYTSVVEGVDDEFIRVKENIIL